jgi:hypothetical protein
MRTYIESFLKVEKYTYTEHVIIDCLAYIVYNLDEIMLSGSFR